MTERDRSLEERLEDARASLEVVARVLTGRFGPEEAARLLGGALLGVTVAAGGRVGALEFLTDLQGQLREEHPENFGVPLG
jgi:hypothetical protein